MCIVLIDFKQIAKVILKSIFLICDECSQFPDFLQVDVHLQQLLPELNVIVWALLQQLLKLYDFDVEEEEPADVHSQVLSLLVIVFDHFDFYLGDLPVELQSISEVGVEEGPGDGVDGLEPVFLSILVDEWQEKIDLFLIVHSFQTVFEQVDQEAKKMKFYFLISFVQFEAYLSTAAILFWILAPSEMAVEIASQDNSRLSSVDGVNHPDQVYRMKRYLRRLL